MPNSPKPLTAPLAPDLDFSRNGVPTSQSFDDIYFSVDGGLEEADAVFLKACGLPERWKDKAVFVIGELGFGSGLNFLATWDLWKKTAKPDQHLHFISIEAYPWSAGGLQKALAHFPSLKDLSTELIAAWPGRVKGVHRMHFGNISLTLFHSDIHPALENMDARIDAWFLDGFSPAKNPDMWSDFVFGHMASHSNDGAMVGTFTAAGFVRRGLTKAGFTVTKQEGFGRKRERLEAFYTAQTMPKPVMDTPVIIGGGIAGASIAHWFLRRGITPILIDPHKHLKTAASGNPGGLVMPRLDLQDRPESRFFLSAYLYALRLYESHGHILKKGVLHMAMGHKECDRFQKIIKGAALPAGQMRWVDHEEAQKLFGSTLTKKLGGLYFPCALTLSPIKTVLSLTKPCTHLNVQVSKITKNNNIWTVLDKDGKAIAQTQNLFICNGANILDLIHEDVRFTSGQINWGASAKKPKCSIIAGNYALAFEEGILIGASHTHVGAGENNASSLKNTQDNLQSYNALTNMELNAQSFQTRSSVRVTTKDTLPIAKKSKDGLYILSGLGSRGLMLAPLLGEYLVCKALAEPSPLCKQTQKRFHRKEG